MTTDSVTATAFASNEMTLTPGPSWTSWEKFRVSGGPGLISSVPANTVGFVTVRGIDFAILRRRDFDRLYSLATDAKRLMMGIPLFRSAAELIWKSGGDEVAIRHFQDLTMTFPELMNAPRQTFDPIQLSEDETDESLLKAHPGQLTIPRANTKHRGRSG